MSFESHGYERVLTMIVTGRGPWSSCDIEVLLRRVVQADRHPRRMSIDARNFEQLYSSRRDRQVEQCRKSGAAMNDSPSVDVKALHAALDAARTEKSLSWRQLAKGIGVSASTVSRMANGLKPDVTAFAAM